MLMVPNKLETKLKITPGSVIEPKKVYVFPEFWPPPKNIDLLLPSKHP